MSKKSRKLHIVAPPDCTGCSLCANVCGHDAIAMVWSERGFLVPQVNENVCINCGVCVKKCPALQPAPIHQDELKDSVPTFGAWNRDREVRMSSSSGGMFSALAELIIRQGGCVFGVVWKDRTTPVFAKAVTMDEIMPMKGSKHTMAVPMHVYREVKAELRSGRNVLFSGTPCQVNALKRYLGKEYENLLSVDIVCHGVPSHFLLERYIADAEKRTGKIVDRVTFHGKKVSWRAYDQTCHFTDGDAHSVCLGEDEYMKAFLSDVVLNRCCYQCRYAHFPRQGDLTLGDLWGADFLHPEWPIEEGISVVLANSPKGVQALELLETSIEVRPIPFHEAFQYQQSVFIRSRRYMPKQREKALAYLKEGGSLEEWLKLFTGIRYVGLIRFRTNGFLYKTACYIFQMIKRLMEI